MKGRDDFKKFIKGSKAEDILLAEGKQHQDYFKSVVPSILITDFGNSSENNPDGSEGRAFYLWKKEKPSWEGGRNTILVFDTGRGWSRCFVYHAYKAIGFGR